MTVGIPHWATDDAMIVRLLHRFVDMCESQTGKTHSEKVTRKKWPELYDFSSEEHTYLWRVVERELHKEYSVIQRIRYHKTGSGPHDHALLIFDSTKEALVRQWLSRPIQLSYAQQWALALEDFPEFRSSLLNNKIQHKAVSANEILAGFKRTKTLIDSLDRQGQEISIRGLSARCFWGDSKFLDDRRNLIYALFPNSTNVVRNRLIMMSAYVPEQLERAIFVENFDSFLSLVAAIKESNHHHTTAIIYSAGYRGTASKIRVRGESQFLTINLCSEPSISQFQSWWYRESDPEVECLFWGDLDFEGVKILKTLRGNFPETKAWQGVYELIVNYHHQGLGHSPEQAGKEKQKLPDKSGCEYSDNVLRPLIIESRRFIDQEVVNKALLLEVLNKSFRAS